MSRNHWEIMRGKRKFGILEYGRIVEIDGNLFKGYVDVSSNFGDYQVKREIYYTRMHSCTLTVIRKVLIR